MYYHLIDDPLCELDDEIPAYDNCEECPYFDDCMEEDEEMDTYQEIKSQLNDLSDGELQALMAATSATIENRKQSHKKELWENVRRAIQDYTEAFGDIEAVDTGYDNHNIRTDCLDKPGYIYLEC